MSKVQEIAGDSGGGGGVPKWVIGVAIGVPVAAALVYILFGPSSDGEPKKKSKKQKSDNSAKTPVKPPAATAPVPSPKQQEKKQEVG